jgi:hypothetical protein
VELNTSANSCIVNPDISSETPGSNIPLKFHSNHLDIIAMERQDVSKFEVVPSIENQTRQALKLIKDVPERHNSTIRCLALSRTDLLDPPARSFTPPQL